VCLLEYYSEREVAVKWRRMRKSVITHLRFIQAAIVKRDADAGVLAEATALAEVDHRPAARDLVHHRGGLTVREVRCGVVLRESKI